MIRTTTAPSPVTLWVIGLALVGAYVVATLTMMQSTPYDLWAAMLIGPVMVAISVPILAAEARRQNDARLLWILIAALVLKLIGSLVRYWMTFSVYGVGDATGYHHAGARMAEAFWSGAPSLEAKGGSGTESLSFITGLIYIVIRPSKLGGFLVYSWLAFWGLFLFFRAFVVGVPDGDRRWYSALVFFLPSLLYWPSGTGKEAWMILTLGIASLGIARLLTGSVFRGALLTAGGALLAATVRPHVAGLIAVSAVGGLLFLRPRSSLVRVGPVLKWVGVAAVVGLTIVLVGQTQEFLGSSVISPGGVVGELQEVAGRADSGGSQFEPTIVRSPLQVPEAAITVLFRPFIFEANNLQAIVAALESTALLLIVLLRLPSIWAAVKSLRRQPYIAFAAIYTALFVIVFAAFPNFGLLARERVQLLPLFAVLLSVHAMRRSRDPAPDPDGLVAGDRR